MGIVGSRIAIGRMHPSVFLLAFNAVGRIIRGPCNEYTHANAQLRRHEYAARIAMNTRPIPPIFIAT